MSRHRPFVSSNPVPFATEECLLKLAEAFTAFLILAVAVGITLTATVAAEARRTIRKRDFSHRVQCSPAD